MKLKNITDTARKLGRGEEFRVEKRNGIVKVDKLESHSAEEYKKQLKKTARAPELFVAAFFQMALLSLGHQPDTTISARILDHVKKKLIIEKGLIAAAIGKQLGTKIKPLQDKVLEIGFDLFIARVESHRFDEVVDRIRYSESANVSLPGDYVEGLTGKRDQVEIAVLKHWVWQVKRKASRLKVKNHVMPILFSRKQGVGKTEGVLQLVAPISDFFLNTTLQEATDDRYHRTLCTNLVAFTDEMARAQRTDVDSLKRLVTASYLSPRILGKNDADHLYARYSLIGASNRRVNELIFDDEMRRFYELHCSPDWEKINAIDYLELWQSIDERLEDGYLVGDLLIECRARQRELASKSDIECFFQDSQISAGEKDDEFVSSDEFFADFLRYKRGGDLGARADISQNQFNKRLRNLGFIDAQRKESGINKRGFWIKRGVA